MSDEAIAAPGLGFPDGFYGFPDVPFHIHLGMRFERREDGSAVVTLPGQDSLLGGDGRHSLAAVYTVGEVAAGIAVCDALAAHGADAETTLMPLVLTKRAVFQPEARPGGDIRSAAEAVGDVAAAAERLRKARKAQVEVESVLRGEGGEVAGTVHVHFYVRMMLLERLEAMAGRLMPAMAERARAALAGRARPG